MSCCAPQVEMGPFKHRVDDGLDVRKAAFECMYTLLDSCLDGLDVLQFLDHVEEGLKDHYDIRVSTDHNKQPCHALPGLNTMQTPWLGGLVLPLLPPPSSLQMLTFLMLARLASLSPAAVLQRLDRLVEPLKATCTTKVPGAFPVLHVPLTCTLTSAPALKPSPVCR